MLLALAVLLAIVAVVGGILAHPLLFLLLVLAAVALIGHTRGSGRRGGLVT